MVELLIPLTNYCSTKLCLQISSDEKPYDCEIPLWLNIYSVVHFTLILYWIVELGVIKNDLPYFSVVALALYFIFSLTNFGLMFDCRCVCM